MTSFAPERTPSLFDSLDDLAAPRPGADAVAPGDLDGRVERIDLGQGAWLDVRPGWLRGSDALFERLVTGVPWQADRRRMYDRVVEVPRLVRHYGTDEALPDDSLATARDALNGWYAARGTEPRQLFRRAGLCFYRTGDDSIAWHGDRVGSTLHLDTMVGIVSLGAARTLAVRARDGGPVRRFPLGHGDLLVMGGSCQRTHEHAIAKTAKAVGPRISVQFRPDWP